MVVDTIDSVSKPYNRKGKSQQIIEVDKMTHAWSSFNWSCKKKAWFCFMQTAKAHTSLCTRVVSSIPIIHSLENKTAKLTSLKVSILKQVYVAAQTGLNIA